VVTTIKIDDRRDKPLTMSGNGGVGEEEAGALDIKELSGRI
jgi:hypothetical protein